MSFQSDDNCLVSAAAKFFSLILMFLLLLCRKVVKGNRVYASGG